MTDIIMIQRPVKSESEFSGSVTTYEDYIRTRANVTHLSGKLAKSGAEMFLSSTVQFTIISIQALYDYKIAGRPFDPSKINFNSSIVRL